MKETVARLKGLLQPGGMMAVFCDEPLGVALKENRLGYDSYDRSQGHYRHLQLKHRVARALQSAFEAEGNGFIVQNLLTESLDSSEPYDPETWRIRRYFYHVQALLFSQKT